MSDVEVVSPSGGWCWFGDPRAIHCRGEHNRTFIGYVTNNGGNPRTGDIVVAQYDHDTAELVHSVVAEDITCDDHNTPSIDLDTHRRVVVFFSGHHDPTLPMCYRRSARPADVGSWDPVQRLRVNTGTGRDSNRYTYPNPVRLCAEPEKLYLFWRGGNFHPNFSTLEADGAWAPAHTLVYYRDGERPYMKVHSNGTDTVHFAFTEGHPRSVFTGIRYMYYRAGLLFRADGTVIRSLEATKQGPIRPDEASVVYDADTHSAKAWVHDIAADADGKPVIVYANFPSDDDHRYRYARWTGQCWRDAEMVAAGDSICPGTNEPNYSGGITLDHDDPSTVLLSRQPEHGGRHRVERWRSPDGGATWEQPEILPQNLDETNVRPLKPRSLAGDGAYSALWMAGEYHRYTDFATRIVALGSGASRLASD